MNSKKYNKQIIIYIQIKGEIRQKVLEEKVEILKKAAVQSNDEKKHIEYGLGKNALIPKIYKRTTNKWQNSRYATVEIIYLKIAVSG